MRAAPISDQVPELMQGAWHLDAHRGPMPGMLDAPELVSAVFKVPRRELAVADEVSTLLNSVHPTSWLGRVYFRLIEIGHHLIMEVALRRLDRAAPNC